MRECPLAVMPGVLCKDRAVHPYGSVINHAYLVEPIVVNLLICETHHAMLQDGWTYEPVLRFEWHWHKESK